MQHSLRKLLGRGVRNVYELRLPRGFHPRCSVHLPRVRNLCQSRAASVLIPGPIAERLNMNPVGVQKLKFQISALRVPIATKKRLTEVLLNGSTADVWGDYVL